MFTGIVEKIGKIEKIENKNTKTYFTIRVEKFLDDVKIGDSISCDGVCLTVVKRESNDFVVELMPETLKLTKFSDSELDDSINLEKSLQLDGRISGHFVMGHVDGVGKVDEIIEENDYVDLVIKVPEKLIKFLPLKGSVSINGVSLTISGAGDDWFKVSLITHTLEETSLSDLKNNDKVNIEIDMIARYLSKLSKK